MTQAGLASTRTLTGVLKDLETLLDSVDVNVGAIEMVDQNINGGAIAGTVGLKASYSESENSIVQRMERMKDRLTELNLRLHKSGQNLLTQF